MKQAYIIKGYRTAVGKAPKGSLRFTRPDVMAATVIEKLMAAVPQLDKDRIDDLIVGNAMPEAEQGLNVARLISLMGLNTDKVPGVTVNRYCASGSEAIAIASAKIQAGMADCIIAGGTGNPFFTTDTASALRGVEIEAEVLLKGTRVDGVYTADPEKDKTATKFDEITFTDAYEKKLKVMDLTAFTMCGENNLPIFVFDMNTPGNLKKVVLGEKIGTLVKN